MSHEIEELKELNETLFKAKDLLKEIYGKLDDFFCDPCDDVIGEAMDSIQLGINNIEDVIANIEEINELKLEVEAAKDEVEGDTD